MELRQLHHHRNLSRSILLFSLAAFFLSFYLLYNANNNFLVYLLFFALFTIPAIRFSNDVTVPKYIIYIMFFGFICRSIYSFFYMDAHIFTFPDTYNYLTNLELVNTKNIFNFYELSLAVGTSQSSYYYLMYAVKLITGGSLYAQYLINILLFYYSSILLFRIVQIDFGNKIASWTVFYYLISMNMFLFTSNILKDSWTLFLFSLSLYLYKKSNKITTILLIVLTVLLTARLYAGVALLVAIYFDFIFLKMSKKSAIKSIFYLVIPTMLLIFLLRSSLFFDLFHNVDKFSSAHSITSYFKGMVLGVFQMIFSPYPYGTLLSGEISPYSIVEFDSAFALIFSFALLKLIMKILKYKTLRNKLIIYIIPVIIHATTLGLAYDGGSVRQRICVFGFLILFYMIGLFYKEEKPS